MPDLNDQQFGEQLRLFDAPAHKAEAEPRYAQLHLPFRASPTPAGKIDWSAPQRQSQWNASVRSKRSLGGVR